MKTEEFDRKFDAGEDVSDYLDFSKSTRPGREHRRVNVDFPVWIAERLEKAASR